MPGWIVVGDGLLTPPYTLCFAKQVLHTGVPSGNSLDTLLLHRGVEHLSSFLRAER